MKPKTTVNNKNEFNIDFPALEINDEANMQNIRKEVILDWQETTQKEK